MYALPLVFLLVVLVAPALRLLLEAWRGDAQGLGVFDALFAPWRDPYVRWRMVWSVVQAMATCGATLVIG